MAAALRVQVMTVVLCTTRVPGLRLIERTLVMLMTEGRPLGPGRGRGRGRPVRSVIVITVSMVHGYPYGHGSIRCFNATACGLSEGPPP
jgi:hypothetical protein